MQTLQGKVALITGGSRGIGVAAGRRLAARGANLYLAAADDEEILAAAAASCRAHAPSAIVQHGRFDFLDRDSAEAMVDSARSVFGRIDILVNNAAIRVRRPLGEYSQQEFDDTIAVNLRAPFFACQAVIPVMRSVGGGRIINIASQMGLIAEQDLALYGLSKAALIHLTMSLAFELAPSNIVVNAVSPGPTMTEYNVERTRQNPDYLKHKLSYIRAGRYGEPDEIAEVVEFLATTSATYMQGHNLVIDGGYVIH